MSYTKTVWRNNQAPAINADNLNHIEQGIESAHNQMAINTSDIETLTTQIQNNATNIASEISARQSGDSSLQSQIDQIIAPSGEAPSAAEVENARIAASVMGGETYDTLGNAIRGQFADVKDEMNYNLNCSSYINETQNNVIKSIVKTADSVELTQNIQFHLGDIISGEIISSLTVAYSGFLDNSASTNLCVGYDSNVYKINICRFDANKNYIGQSSFINIEPIRIRDYITDPYIRITVKRNDNTNLSLADLFVYLISTSVNNIVHFDDVATSICKTNCVDIVPFLHLKQDTSAGMTYTPSENGNVITSVGTPTGNTIYYLAHGNIENYPQFKKGGSYRIAYKGVENSYIQIIADNTTLLSVEGFDGVKIVTIPDITSELSVRIYGLSTTVAGTHYISITNCRELDYLEKYSLEKTSDSKIKQYLGYDKVNVLDGIEVYDGYYISYANGKRVALSSFSATDFFVVSPSMTYDIVGGTSGSQIAYYDADYNYISGVILNSGTKVIVPDNDSICFARWCTSTEEVDTWGFYLVPIIEMSKTKTITEAEGLLEGLLDAYDKGVSDIYVEAGTYNVIDEYESYYGTNYFINYTNGYNGLVHGLFDAGLFLYNVNIKFSSGAKVVAHYTGSNQNVKNDFSAFAVKGNVVIDGLVLDALELRYGIHPDFHDSDNEVLVVKNSDLHHYKSSSTSIHNNQAIGAGLGVYSAWIFENCIFRSDTNNPVLRIHNNVSERSQSKVIVKDNYIVGNGYFLFNAYSTSELQTIIQVCGCSYKTAPVVGKETQASNENFTMIAWNNELRS